MIEETMMVKIHLMLASNDDINTQAVNEASYRVIQDNESIKVLALADGVGPFKYVVISHDGVPVAWFEVSTTPMTLARGEAVVIQASR